VTVGTSATINVTLTGGVSVSGIKIWYSVSGANATGGSVTTDADGHASFSYSGSNLGQDTVTAWAYLNGNVNRDAGEPAASTSVSWVAQTQAALGLTGPAASVTVGSNQTVTATLSNVSSLSGVTISFSVSGANTASGTVATDGNGQASFSYSGGNAGMDTVAAWADLNGNGSQDSGEPSASTSIAWTAAPAPPSQPTLAQQMMPPVAPKTGCTYFPATGHNLCAGFAAYWNQFGGLAIFGMPITDEFVLNGMTVQFFERARFEWHPGAWPERYDVLLGLLGDEVTAGQHGAAPFTPVSANGDCTYFAATGHNLCGAFASYWNQYGGLAIFGMPISEQFVDPATGLVTQYFERARFELHPGAWPERLDVMLGLLGAQDLNLS
jgi:hypothetical protein